METELTEFPPFPNIAERDSALFRALIRTTRDGVIVTDKDGNVLIYNEACTRLFQHAPEDILGQSVSMLFPPAHHDEFPNSIRLIDTAHTAVEREVHALRKDGSVFPVQLSIGKGWLDGTPVFLAVVHDLTALHRERVALDEEKAYLALITESSNDAIISYMVDGTLRTWNRAAEEMFGYRADEVIGATAHSLAPMFVPPELIDIELEHFRQALAGGVVAPHNSVRLHRDGTRIDVQVSVSPIRDASGVVIGIARTLRDIRERKSHETERALLALAIDSSDDAFICIDLDGVTRSWNRAAEKLLGYSANEMIGKHASRAVPTLNPPEQVERELEYSRRATAGEKIGPYETVRIRKDGSRVEVVSSLAPVRNERGEILAVIRVLRDLSERKSYERQTAFLGAIVASSGEAIVSVDREGKIATWNHAAEEMYGWTAEEMLGTDFRTAVSRVAKPERVPEEEKIYATVMSGGRVAPFEVVRQRKDGSPLYARISVSPILDASGAIIGISRITHDLGERRAYEEQRALLSAIVDSSNDAVISYDLKGNITSFNRAAEAMYGYKAEEVIGMNLLDTLSLVGGSPEQREEEKEILARLFAGEVVPPYERQRRRKDGTPLHVLASVSTIRDSAGKIIGTSRIVRDIGERKALEQQRALFSAIVESSNDAVYTETLDGVVTSWNAAAEAMFGFKAEEIVGKTMMSLIPADRANEEHEVIRRILDGETVRHYETVRLRRDGTPFDASITTSPLRDASGKIFGASKTIRDITERKAYEAHLQSLREDLIHVARVNELSQVSAGIAHELNQPLAAMLNYSNTAKRIVAQGGPTASEKLSAIIGKVGEQAERAGQIIRRMRDFVEKREPHRAIENINSIADDAVALALIGSKSANITTRFVHTPEAPPVFVDRVQIQQVLVNLLRNAAEAMDRMPRRELTLSIEKVSEEMLTVAVADTGSGIPEDVARRLFTPFVTTKENGMGIGLAISKSIVEAHGGELSVQPNPGGGTIFCFTLPAATAET